MASRIRRPSMKSLTCFANNCLGASCLNSSYDILRAAIHKDEKRLAEFNC
jgi:hypothetical protein